MTIGRELYGGNISDEGFNMHHSTIAIGGDNINICYLMTCKKSIESEAITEFYNE